MSNEREQPFMDAIAWRFYCQCMLSFEVRNAGVHSVTCTCGRTYRIPKSLRTAALPKTEDGRPQSIDDLEFDAAMALGVEEEEPWA